MPWPTIPPLIFTDTTSWSKASWTTGKIADRQPSYGAFGPNLACSVAPVSAEMQDVHGRQGMMVTHAVTFDASNYPGLKIRDKGNWLEGNKTLTVVGVTPQGDATGRIYVVACQELPIP